MEVFILIMLGILSVGYYCSALSIPIEENEKEVEK